MMGSPPPDVLGFKIYVSARYTNLDTKTKYHRVMRCCPSCGAPLVLFREKFGEYSPSRRSPGAPSSPPTSTPSLDTGQSRDTGGLPGGWVCTKCGLHIVAMEKGQNNALSPRGRKLNSPRSPPGDAGMTRDATPPRSDVHNSHHGTPPSPSRHAGGLGSNPPSSPTTPVLIDDEYENWERTVSNSFMSFMSQIRERLGEKELALKQYQIALCQRERQLRSNEEGMTQRINKVKQSEQNFKTKMDRLNLYKDTMINQLEAKAKQLTKYEQRIRDNNGYDDLKSKGSKENLNEEKRDLKLTKDEYKGLADEKEKGMNVSRDTIMIDTSFSNRNISINSSKANTSFSTQNDPVRRVSRSPPEKDDKHVYRSNIGIKMVQPLDIRTSVTSLQGNIRGSHGSLTRDFRPNGASSANINQIYTNKDTSNISKRPNLTQGHMYSNKEPSNMSRLNLPQGQKYHQTQISLTNPHENGYYDNVKNRAWQQNPRPSSRPVPHSEAYNPQTSNSDISQKSYTQQRVLTESRIPMSQRNGSVSDIRGPKQYVAPQTLPPPPPQLNHVPLKSALRSPDHSSSITHRWGISSGSMNKGSLHVSTNGHHKQSHATSYVEQDSGSPNERERSTSVFSDLSPTYTTSGYASDKDTSANSVKREKHNVSFDDMISTSSPGNTTERDTRPPWMKRRSRRLTEV